MNCWYGIHYEDSNDAIIKNNVFKANVQALTIDAVSNGFLVNITGNDFRDNEIDIFSDIASDAQSSDNYWS